MEGHYRYQCPQKKERQERERRINSIHAKVGLNAVNQREHNIEGWKNKELLPVVNLNIMGQKVEAIRDSGAEISVFRKELIPDKCLTGGHIYLVPAVGEMEKADLITLPVASWKDSQSISSEIDIIAAATENLNSPALITPSVYDALSEQEKLYSVNINLINAETQETTGREGDSVNSDSNIENQITSNSGLSSEMG